MPNQNYIEAREDLKIAQCDLSLSYPTCKTEERFCKFAYASWCPTCDKESPRRRSKSETNEPCRKKGREMKGVPKKCPWNQEYENMDLEYEMKDIRYDTYRVRSNLCELPTTYITNNCQIMKLSNCSPDINDIAEKGVKCYENTLKSNDYHSQFQNLNSMVDRQDRVSKLFPKIDDTTRNGFVNKINLRPHIHPSNPTSAPCYLEHKRSEPLKVSDTKTWINGTIAQRFQTFSPKNNELQNLELRNRSRYINELNFNIELKGDNTNSPLYYDTNTYFDKKVDVMELKERYTRELGLLQGRIQELRNKTYDKEDAKLKQTGTVPKVPLVNNKPKDSETSPNKFKSNSKISLKTKGKLGATKLWKQKNRICNNALVNSDPSDSDFGSSDDSEKEFDLKESNNSDQLSTESSIKEALSNDSIQLGAGDFETWPLRHSLFPHIPPYLCFSQHNAENPQKLPRGSRYLKWKLSNITPVLIRRTLTNSGFTLVRSESPEKSNEWLGTWGKHVKSPMFKTIKDTQKVNHFPGTFQIGRKDRLWRNLQKLMHKHGQKEFGFIPRTYVLPHDLKLLKQHWQNKNGEGEEMYIIKPPASARGTGIKVINRWSQLPKRMSLVVQEYISKPYLINRSKFDLRLYVLVTSFDPLRIYLYPDGLARFASVPYSADIKDLRDRYMHLTNYSINKLSVMYTANEDANSCKGHKWTLSKLWEYMERRGIDTKALWKNLQQLVIKTIISGESNIVPLCRENLNSRYNCYELFGVDVLLDEHLKTWLLEVNISPSLHSQSPLDEYVKGPMVQHLFEIAQFHLPPRLGKLDNKLIPQCLDARLYTTMLTKQERNKQNYFCQFENRQEYLDEILNNLTGDDVRHLTQAEDELMAIGQFERIFPTSNTYKYLNFLDVRYYNRLFDAWENKYEKNRKPGIEILQSLCEQKIHLKVAPPTAINKNLPNLNCGEPNLLLSKEKMTTNDLPTAITINQLPPVIEINRANTTTNKPSTIQSLYDAIYMQSERASMMLSPYATHV